MRVRRLVTGGASGTSFTIEVDSRQYMITAKHVVAGMVGNAKVTIHADANNNEEIDVEIYPCGGTIDVAVLVPKKQITVNYPLLPQSKGAHISQEMFFVGFPFSDYALTTHDGQSAIGFVRKATFSAQQNENGVTTLYLDGTNNPGFSGGPVVYWDANDQNGPMRVAGVVSGYRSDLAEVLGAASIAAADVAKEDPASIRRKADGSFIKLIPTGQWVVTNTGVVVAYPIDYAVDLINKNGLLGPKVA